MSKHAHNNSIPQKRKRLPPGHRYFADPEREVSANMIAWSLAKAGDSAVFATLTFKNETSVYKANKMRKRWLARASQSLNDSGGSQLKSITASEWQKREVIHFHLLLVGNGVDTLSRKRLEYRWEAMGGGFCRCYEADRKAAPYLAKYTSKNLGGELQWDGAWQAVKFPASVSRYHVGALSVAGQ